MKKNTILIIIFLTVFFGCSSAPQKPADVFADRNMAVRQLDLANHSANRGQYETALLIMEEARRLALSTDDPVLRIRTSISRGNILFSMGRQAEAFEEWEAATAEGDAWGEAVLAALARIYTIRGSLVQLADEPQGNNSAAQEYRDRLSQLLTIVRSDHHAVAAAQLSLGLAEKQLGRWAEAESAVRRAMDIYERNRMLEDAAYCWFIIASIRSVAGNYEASLDALMAAIRLDRRAENGYGLASSWQAIGDVQQMAGQMEESRAAYRRAAEIYRAIGLIDQAVELEAKN